MKIAIIGAGNMGGAIARGLAQSSLTAPSDLIVSNPTPAKLDRLKQEFPEIAVTQHNLVAVSKADIIILCVKPWLMEEVISKLELKSHHLLVSVAAGVSFEELDSYIGTLRIPLFRLIPNTAVSERESMTIVASHRATGEQEQLILRLFKELGDVILLPEAQMAAATSIASCGTAYAMKYIQAGMQAGVEMGLRPQDAMRMMAQTLKGAAALIQNNDTHPAVEIDKVTTPGGLTIKGVNELEHNGFVSALIKAMKASV